MSARINPAVGTAGVAQLVEQLICNQQVGGSNPSTSSKFHMGEFQSGQMGQTVNLLSLTSVVRIHLPPPNVQSKDWTFCFFGVSLPFTDGKAGILTVFFEKTGKTEKLKERMIVTFSTKYAIYQKSLRDKQISRAKEIIEKNPEKYLRKSQTDAKRFIKCEKITNDGECAEKYKLYYKDELEEYEQQFDGMYAVCTPENMDGGIEEI